MPNLTPHNVCQLGLSFLSSKPPLTQEETSDNTAHDLAIVVVHDKLAVLERLKAVVSERW
jgi:hypothetical protein